MAVAVAVAVVVVVVLVVVAVMCILDQNWSCRSCDINTCGTRLDCINPVLAVHSPLPRKAIFASLACLNLGCGIWWFAKIMGHVSRIFGDSSLVSS